MQVVICFHASLPGYERLCKLHEACECPLPIVDFKDVCFTQLRVIVAWNPRVGNMVDGLLDPNTFRHLFFGNGNEQILFLCLDYPNGIDASISFLRQDFFLDMTSLLLFGPIPWQRNLRALFDKVGMMLD
jgi:hypothetical protein